MQWIQHNFWWVFPAVIGPGLIVLTVVVRRRVLPQPVDMSWRARLDSIAKTCLTAFALLMEYVAYSTHSYLALVPPLFMIFGVNGGVIVKRPFPTWARYASYFGLFIVYLIIWEPPRDD